MKRFACALLFCLVVGRSSYGRTFKDIAGNYTGLVQSAGGDVASAGLVSLDVSRTARFTGFILIAGYRITLKGDFGDNSSSFGFTGTIADIVTPQGQTTFVMRASLDTDSRLVTGSIDITYPDRSTSTPFALNGQEADEEVARALKGRKLTAFINPPVAGTTQEIPGDGFAAVTVSKEKRPSLRYVGQLPDAEGYSVGGHLHGREFYLFSILYPPRIEFRLSGFGLALDGFFVTSPILALAPRVAVGRPAVPVPGRAWRGLPNIPFFREGGRVKTDQSPQSAGVIIGTVEATVGKDGEPILSSPVAWKKRPGQSLNYYSNGFDVVVSVLASVYDPKVPPLDIDKNVSDNTSVKLRRGNLPEDVEVIVDTRHYFPTVVRTIGSFQTNPNHFKLRVNRFDGTFHGSFVHPSSDKLTPFRGAFLPKTNVSVGEGRGSFQGSVSASDTSLPESGSVRIAPRNGRGAPF